MKMTVQLLMFYIFALAFANPNDQSQIERYGDKIKTYQLEVPAKKPITIMETAPATELRNKWEDIPIDSDEDKDDVEIKNIMTDIIHDINGNRPRCYGPSCQESFDDKDGSHEAIEEYLSENPSNLKDYREFSQDRLQAINALAEKLKREKLKADRYSSINNMENEDGENSKIYTSWNRVKVKQHKHPYDDKEGWVTLEPIAWSSSKISKWKPNVKKTKPNHWYEDSDSFLNDDSSYQETVNSYNYPKKRPTTVRPTFLNNKLHMSSDYDTEIPSKPSWNKPQQIPYNFQSSWSSDDRRRPYKPNCDPEENYPNEDTMYYGLSDSVITDRRPSNFPHESDVSHQVFKQKRPSRRPTQVMYADNVNFDNNGASKPPYGDGQWVLLSTTKGYRNKKRQRSLNPIPDDRSDLSSMTSHQAVALTVLPVENASTNMTTSHGGLLEVEKSFQTVEESKQDLDKQNDLDVTASQNRPVVNKIIKRKLVSNVSPDSSTVLAAVGAGMVPATMAMVVPMILGRRRRRRDLRELKDLHLDNILYRYQ